MDLTIQINPTLMNSSMEIVPERSVSDEKKTVWNVVGDKLILYAMHILLIPNMRQCLL